MEYGKECRSDGALKSICCDGLVRGADLHLTHWTNNETPAELYADTSTEIAMNFIQSGQGVPFFIFVTLVKLYAPLH